MKQGDKSFIQAVDNEGFNALHYACFNVDRLLTEKDRVNIVMMLLKAGIDINSRSTSSGLTPLHLLGILFRLSYLRNASLS